MQGYSDVYKWTILKRTSPEVKCLHPTSSRREMCTLSVSNVIYHKFSHGAAFYMLSGKNVNVMLEFSLKNAERKILMQVYPFTILHFKVSSFIKTLEVNALKRCMYMYMFSKCEHVCPWNLLYSTVVVTDPP